MRVRVDRQADAVYLNLTDAAIEASEEVADGIVVNYDAGGRIVGVEILDASQRTGDPEALTEMSFELPAPENLQKRVLCVGRHKTPAANVDLADASNVDHHACDVSICIDLPPSGGISRIP